MYVKIFFISQHSKGESQFVLRTFQLCISVPKQNPFLKTSYPVKCLRILNANIKQQHPTLFYGIESNMESRSSPDQPFKDGAENEQAKVTADKWSQTDHAERTETSEKGQLSASALEWRKKIKAREVNMGTGFFVDINNMLDEEKQRKRAAAQAQQKTSAYTCSSDIWMVNIKTDPPTLDEPALDQQACVSRHVANVVRLPLPL